MLQGVMTASAVRRGKDTEKWERKDVMDRGLFLRRGRMGGREQLVVCTSTLQFCLKNATPYVAQQKLEYLQEILPNSAAR